MGAGQDLHGKTIFVTGGSGGLGKAIAKASASRGAHVTIFARRQGPLREARDEIRGQALSASQVIDSVTLDAADASKVDMAFRAQPRIPDVVYCVAGGNHAENGFLVDITAADVESCMRNNYFSAAYPAKSILDIWTDHDKNTRAAESLRPPRPKLRRIVFVSSAAAFLGLPGSVAYTPAKCAVRALADSLRMEVLRYSCPESAYTIHCVFPGDFVSPGFYLEQGTKTDLTKRIQGTNRSIAELESRYPSSDDVASLVIAAVERGDFIICKDSMAASLLFTNMIGPSPKRGWGIVDSLMGLVVGWLVWPVLRRRWEAMSRKSGEESRRSEELWAIFDPGL